MSAKRADAYLAARSCAGGHHDESPLLDTELIDAAPDLQYGGRTFESASEYVRELRCWDEPARARLTRAVKNIDGSRAIAAELTGLHTVPVALSGSVAGRVIAGHLAEKRWGVHRNCVAQGILLLPPTFSDYLRGRARQAMRTNIRAAAAEGITCCRLAPESIESTFERWLGQGLLPEKLEIHYRYRYPTAIRDARWYVALDAMSSPVGVAKVWVDSEWALLSGLACVSHQARWLLHTHVVEELYGAGVRKLCVYDGLSLQMSPALQYFQRRLGYRIAHLRLASAPRALLYGGTVEPLSAWLPPDSIVTRAGLAAAVAKW